MVFNARIRMILPGEAGASPNTILSYRDTFLLFIKYCKAQENTPPEEMTLELLTKELVCAFLSWLENERNCSVSTRNQRLAALHSFCRFMQTEDVMRINQYQLVISIPQKRGKSGTVNYMSPDGVKLILEQPDAKKDVWPQGHGFAESDVRFWRSSSGDG
jgi:site-specific recombinase XerD